MLFGLTDRRETRLSLMMGVALLFITYSLFSIRAVLDHVDPGELLSLKRSIATSAGALVFFLIASTYRVVGAAPRFERLALLAFFCRFGRSSRVLDRGRLSLVCRTGNRSCVAEQCALGVRLVRFPSCGALRVFGCNFALCRQRQLPLRNTENESGLNATAVGAPDPALSDGVWAYQEADPAPR